MELWQYLLVSVTAIIVALLIGISIAHLIIRFVYKDARFPFFRLFYLLFRRNPGILMPRDSALQSNDEYSMSPQVRELIEFPLPELLAEFEHNCRIATEFSGDNLLPLQTNVWDACQYSSNELPTNLRVETEQVYADIILLNKLVWLSTELGCQSSSLDDYKKLLTRIVERINKIEQVLVFVK